MGDIGSEQKVWHLANAKVPGARNKENDETTFCKMPTQLTPSAKLISSDRTQALFKYHIKGSHRHQNLGW